MEHTNGWRSHSITIKKSIAVLASAILCFIGILPGYAQQRGDLRIMFYNTENLFDTENDPNTLDDDFTPEGKMHWTEARYRQKLNNIYKVIAAVGEQESPEIIGLAEVENKKVLVDLTFLTPLSRFNYDIVHFESPDPRGIDVALLYRKDKLKVLKKSPIPVIFEKIPTHSTRDILYVQLLTGTNDTLNLFVNHWPSRIHGENETEYLRKQTALILRENVDLLFSANASAKIIIMGDFNDAPSNESISIVLKAKEIIQNPVSPALYDLSANLSKTSSIATHQFKGHWEMFDQFIVSGGLLTATQRLYTSPNDVHIFTEKFLLKENQRSLTPKLLPTYSGPRYIGGFSDHLPIYLDLFVKK